MKVKSRTAFFFQREVMLMVLLMLGLLMSALLLIFFKYEQRVLFAKLQKLQKQEDSYYIERGKLLLEQSTWATPGTIREDCSFKIGYEVTQAQRLCIDKT